MLGGCVSPSVRIADIEALEGAGTRIELETTPFFPQEEYQCGPAALATVLGAAGLSVQPADLVREVYTPGLEGSLQSEMLGAVRRRGLLPYEVSGDLNGLLAQVVAGKPVLVLQNLGLESFPVWHYAVVIGLDPDKKQFILRSGGERRLTMSVRKFVRTWDRADRWGFVVVTPGELPAALNPVAYSQAVAGLESTGHYPAAAVAWEAGLERSPDEPIYLFGLGNTRYRLGDLAGARAAWERFVRFRPGDPAGLNNLAVVLGETGCARRGRALAERALEYIGQQGGPMKAEIESTLERLEALPTVDERPECQAPPQ